MRSYCNPAYVECRIGHVHSGAKPNPIAELLHRQLPYPMSLEPRQLRLVHGPLPPTPKRTAPAHESALGPTGNPLVQWLSDNISAVHDASSRRERGAAWSVNFAANTRQLPAWSYSAKRLSEHGSA